MANLQLTHCLLLVITFISLSWNGAQAGRKCLEIIPTGGYTFPQGDIILEKGSDLNITCVLNKKYASKYGPAASSLLSFLLGDDHIPSEIVNSTARRLYVKNHPITEKADYYCLMNGTYICHNVIAVGTKPQNVTDFDCMGQNLNNFTCTWTAPLNYVRTDYYLSYTPVTESGRSLTSECPHELNESKIGNKTIMSCTWSLGSTPLYRHSHSSFVFGLVANDTFGSRNWTYLINHYSHVRPNPPTEFGAISKSPHSIQLEWSLPVLMLSFPGGLRYRVCWCNEQSKEWNTIYLPNKTLSKHFYVKDHHRYFLLDNLPYAHCIYDIRISMQPRVAADDRMWSQNASMTIRTLSKIPDCPPNTTLGGFEILDGVGKRIIYWQSIHSYQENGDNLTYKIQALEDSSIKPVELLKKYAVFDKLPNRNLTFKIWSVNNEGKSLDHSVVFVPAEKYALKPVRKLIKKDNGNGKYNIQWIDNGDSKTTHFTLFWCTALMERPYPCQGNLNWLILQRGMKNKTLQLPVFDTENNRSISNYQFAISVNGIDSSSGLLWADCTILHGRGKRKLSQTYLKTVSSRYIVIQIHLGCITLTDIQGFNVSYCQILQPGSEECQPNTLNYKFFDVDNDTFDGDAELNITNLIPYTGYQIRVKPIVLGSELEFGDSMFNSTIEDTPSEPTNVQVLRREPRLLTLHWEPPDEANGHIREYRIYVRSPTQTLPPMTVTYVNDLKKYSRDITGLLPRSQYTIGVSACTKTCSPYATINASTDINFPGVITKPSANWNDLTTILKWEKPDELETIVDFYELQVANDDGRQHNYTTQNVTFSLGEICEKDQTQTMYVKVRGVNVRYNQTLPGPWSQSADFPCIRSTVSMSWIFSLIAIAILVIFVITIFATRRSVQKAIGQRLCEVKLPSALDAAANVEYSMAEIQRDRRELSQNWNCDTTAKVPSRGYLPCYPEEDPNANTGSYVIAGNPLSMPVETQATTAVPEDVSAENYKVLPIETLKLLWQKPAPEVTSAGYLLVGNSKNENDFSRISRDQ